jgi:glycosyltransferase involved in cell wall biosynthesis
MTTTQGSAPLVAIVTPVYNGARYLAETMECVQAQTYPNLVHAVLDNASTDETPQIIESFRNRRVPLLTHRNGTLLSQCSNWNAALGMVPGEAAYFRVICADELMTPDATQRMVQLAETDTEIGLVGSLVGESGAPVDPDLICCVGLPQDRQVFDGRWVIKGYLIQMHRSMSPTHVLIRRDYLDQRVPFYNEKYMMSDLDVCLWMLLNSKYGFIHAPISWSRVHEASVSATVHTDQVTAQEWLDFIDQYAPLTMSEEEHRMCRRSHLRHHFRRLLLWRFKERNRAKYNTHLEFLRGRSAAPALTDYVEALAEWVMLRVQNRRDDIGSTRSLWAKVHSELNMPALTCGQEQKTQAVKDKRFIL